MSSGAPIGVAVAALSREAVVAAGFVFVALAGGRRVEVQWAGKAGTFGLMFAYPAFLLGYGNAGWQEPVKVIAWVTGIIGLALAWYAAGSYIGPARMALREGRAARRSRKAEPGMNAEPGIKGNPA